MFGHDVGYIRKPKPSSTDRIIRNTVRYKDVRTAAIAKVNRNDDVVGKYLRGF